MTNDQKLPPFVSADGVNLAAFDTVIILAKIISEMSPAMKDAVCGGLQERFAGHQRIVDEHGTVANTNAAAALRLVMISIGCENIPDHR